MKASIGRYGAATLLLCDTLACSSRAEAARNYLIGKGVAEQELGVPGK